MHWIRELSRLLHAWRTQDRIRDAPGVGGLLNLQPGRRLLVRGWLYHIEHRRSAVDTSASDALATAMEWTDGGSDDLGSAELEVTYTLTDVESEAVAELHISLQLARPGHGTIALVRDSSTMELLIEDVCVLAASGV